MLTTARAALPAPIAARLKGSADFVDDITDFARDNILGFKRPIAATFALLTPVLLALAYYTYDLPTVSKLAIFVCLMTGAGLYLVARENWPKIVDEFQFKSVAKRRALADLQCGFGETSSLNLERAPRFFEYEHGVLVFVDAGEWRTVFFSIQQGEDDPRWTLYANGEFERRVWQWMRLPVSREVVKFSTVGTKFPHVEPPLRIRSIEAWEAVNLAFGEPVDGAIIHQAFEDVVEMAERLL